MTPRSWKPDFSLAETVPDSQAQLHIDDVNTALKLTTQGQDDVNSVVDADVAAEIALLNVERLQRSVAEPR